MAYARFTDKTLIGFSDMAADCITTVDIEAIAEDNRLFWTENNSIQAGP